MPPSVSSLFERRDGASLRDGVEAFGRGVAAWPPPADGEPNPAFPVTVRGAERDLRRMAADPKPLARPLVLVGGWLDPVLGMHNVQKRLTPCFREPRFLRVHHNVFTSHRAYRDRLVDRVHAAFADGEVDVVAHSMGGLIARYAAMRLGGRAGLRLGTLFTVGTCHRGAAMAPVVQLEPLARDMVPGCSHLAALDAALPGRDYELVCYARLQDELVGTDRCAPEGHPLHWVPNRRFQRAHWRCKDDPRILADVARRLRGEPPLATPPASDLPSQA